jgi:pimeloyl-ACP methyl ester carboxylesterase
LAQTAVQILCNLVFAPWSSPSLRATIADGVDGSETPQLDELQGALDAGDIDRVRRVLARVDGREEQLLREELGPAAFQRARLAASRSARGGKLGRVLVLPGIMGTELDAVDAKGDSDRIWLHYLRLIQGRIGDLELKPDGSPAVPGVHVRPAGVHRKTYLAMILELDTRWHVRPFPFDWRESIDKSADRLAGEVQAFANGEPLHLVAHSMGGLVSRRFIQRHRDVWNSMDDSTGGGRGGRLVMLGTPNRGSFAIPLTLTGGEKLVKLLAKADQPHNLEQLLGIIGTFPGLYQMLPSPLVDLGDDHEQLFDRQAWGDVPASENLLSSAAELIRGLHDVIDPKRLLYVAGFNRKTPSRIRIDEPGRFSYQQTSDGDGRVPHALGLLDGVTTYWVDEIHGNLAKNGSVLDAITELLQTGATSRLPTAKPAQRGPTPGTNGKWVSGRDIEPVEPEIDTILTGAKARGAADEPQLTPEEAIRVENLGFAEYLGTSDTSADAGTSNGAARAAARPEAPPTSIRIEVVWGDVTHVEADVYSVGHYEGLEPQRAELALDRAVSGVGEHEQADGRFVITQHSRRGMLRGALGDVSFFPWGRGSHSGRTVAVAGMGRPGTFDRVRLEQLVRTLMLAVGALPNAQTVGTVLIGSGEGTLSIRDAVRGLVVGIRDAIDEIAASEELRSVAPIKVLRIVEQERGRAEKIQNELELAVDALRPKRAERRRAAVEFELTKLKTGKSGVVSIEESIALLADSALGQASESGSSASAALEELLAHAPATPKVRKLALEELTGAGASLGTGSRERPFRVTLEPDGSRDPAAVRVSFWKDGPGIRAAAIHSAATVPERVVTVGSGLVEDLVKKMTNPRADEVDDLCRLLYRLLVPTEFREVLQSGPFVFEVDRPMAQVHWEMLANLGSERGPQRPLAVDLPLARQMRTQYSPSPLPPRPPRDRLRALVIGDPGDPAKGEDLPGARREALHVAGLLRERGVTVEARIGAPSVPREGELLGVKAADRIEVLGLLLDGGFDLLHYSGHGDFDPADPRRAGWLFETGLLTGGEIGRMEHVPSIVVANACLSAQTSQALAGAPSPEDPRTEAGLLPSLADEFFKLGVRDYVGTAWEVNDVGAELFAETFYEALLPMDLSTGAPFGEAIRQAREALWNRREYFGALWAAYQHYGDPTVHTGVTAGSTADV